MKTSGTTGISGLGRSLRRGVTVGALALAGLAVTAVPAWGAGTSYGGGGGGTSTFPGLPGSVVTTCTVVSATAPLSCTASIGGNTITVTDPAGDLPVGAQIVITSVTGDTPVDGTPVLEFAIGVFVNGVKLTTTFSQPLSVTISGADITATTKAYQQTSSGFTPIVSMNQTGAMTFPMPADPAYQVDNPPTAAVPIAGATLAVTGKPFLAEELVAGTLILVGSSLLLGLRLRRRRTA
jgi:microcystin-dependent protein